MNSIHLSRYIDGKNEPPHSGTAYIYICCKSKGHPCRFLIVIIAGTPPPFKSPLHLSTIKDLMHVTDNNLKDNKKQTIMNKYIFHSFSSLFFSIRLAII